MITRIVSSRVVQRTSKNKAFMITRLVSSRVVQRTSKQGLQDHTASQFEGRAAHVQTSLHDQTASQFEGREAHVQTRPS
ncbi:hypothetical protein DPMN_177957 [Dreissena polymorpha]|uniref:Uncharacterized protein n=1 Tax=Dreissena polymorpha TaxID=45954 RepID=A0A9D4E9P4_DREPO|nr:hypothetical protein DPMN_177957 [Dreissena polymorpha]